MSLDQLVVIALGIVIALWWLDCAPLYILAGKAGIESPGWAFVPVVQFDIMGRVAAAHSLAGLYGPESRTMPWRRNLWAEIAGASGLRRKVGQMCLVPGPRILGQWIIALRV